VRRAVRWVVRDHELMTADAAVVEHYRCALEQLHRAMPRLLGQRSLAGFQSRCDALAADSVHSDWLTALAVPASLYSGLGAIAAARAVNVDVLEAGSVYFSLFDALNLDFLSEGLSQVEIDNTWQAIAREGFLEDVDLRLQAITRHLLERRQTASDWLDQHDAGVRRWCALVDSLRAGDADDFAAFAVALKQLDHLASQRS